MATGIRVVSAAGSDQIDVPHSLLRRPVAAARVPPASVFCRLSSARDRRGLHDRFAGTRVVKQAVGVKRSDSFGADPSRPSFGVGYVPFAPGTFGSAAGLVIWALLPSSRWPRRPRPSGDVRRSGAWSGTVAERHFGRTDPGPVVIDEVMGMLLTLFMHPVGLDGALAGFFLFRVVRRPQALPGQSPRAAAWRPRCDGGRRDGGGVREPRAAALVRHLSRSMTGMIDEGLHHRRRQRDADAFSRRHELAGRLPNG